MNSLTTSTDQLGAWTITVLDPDNAVLATYASADYATEADALAQIVTDGWMTDAEILAQPASYDTTGDPDRSHTYLMANAQMADDVAVPADFLKVNVAAGMAGVRLQFNQRVLLHDMVAVPGGDVTLAPVPSAGNSRIDAVVYDTGDSTLKAVTGPEFPSADPILQPVVTIGQRVIQLYRVDDTDTATANADIPSILTFDIGGATVTFKGSTVTDTSPYAATAYIASTGSSTGIWEVAGRLSATRYYAFIVSHLALQQAYYGYSASDILNGNWLVSSTTGSGGYPAIAYNNGSSGLLAALLNDAVDELAARSTGVYTYTLTAADFIAAAPPGDSTYTMATGGITVPAGERLVSVRTQLVTPYDVTGATDVQARLAYPASGGYISSVASVIVGGTLDLQAAGFKYVDEGPDPTVPLASFATDVPNELYAHLEIQGATFADMVSGTFVFTVQTQKLPA